MDALWAGLLRRAALLGGLLATALLLVACGGGSDGDGTALPARAVGPEAFAAALAEPERVSLNVHVPDEGSIAGTDLSIPFDELEARRGELPDPSTPLALYCRSGNMSAPAVRTLAGLGFTDVVELEGGMLAWEEAGRPLLPAASG
jgi:rhodanese-related sulfurtransferase